MGARACALARGTETEYIYAYICIHIHVIQIQVQRSANLTASYTRDVNIVIHIVRIYRLVYIGLVEMITCILHSPYYNHLFC